MPSIFKQQQQMAYLTVIPFAEVFASQQSDRLFNTTSHTNAEISAILPDIAHHPPPPQPWILLTPFLPLIASSQNIPLDQIHEIVLPHPFLLFLLHAHPVALSLGHIPTSDAEDLASLFPLTTTRGTSIDSVLGTSSTKWFPRLDTCSLKDAILTSGPNISPTDPIPSTTDLWTRLASSFRGIHGIQDLRRHEAGAGAGAGSQIPIRLYLLPWRSDIRPELEYRCFCAPPRGELVAISQYRWYEPWVHSTKTTEEQERIVATLARNVAALRERLMLYLDTRANVEAELCARLKERGLVMDVVEEPGCQEVRLLELNGFGARELSGSCLFQWVRDARVLYGMEVESGVQVRVTY